MIETETREQFWARTAAALAEIPLGESVELVELEGPMESRHKDLVNNFRVTLSSFRGVRIRAWFTYPDGKPPPTGWPTIMMMPGYTGIVPLPVHFVRYGFAALTLFPRGQGESGDEWQIDQGTWATFNAEDPEAYYYRGAYMDCVRGVDFLHTRPEVDPDRIAVVGQSQGGGLALATAALDPRIRAAVAETPWPCNIPLLVATTTAPPNHEFSDFLRTRATRSQLILEKLGIFDSVNLAERISCPILMSASQVDDVHPLNTVESVFAKISSLKSLIVYPDLNHGHRNDFARHTLNWLDAYLR